MITAYRKFENSKFNGVALINIVDRVSDGSWDQETICRESKDRRELAHEFLASLPADHVYGVAESNGDNGAVATVVYYRKPTGSLPAAKGSDDRVCRGTITGGRAEGARAILLTEPAGSPAMCRVELLTRP